MRRHARGPSDADGAALAGDAATVRAPDVAGDAEDDPVAGDVQPTTIATAMSSPRMRSL